LVSGTHHVTLTVTDNNGATDDDTIEVIISKANTPPSNPIIKGPATGHKQINYNFTVSSTDKDNDTIQYIIDWGDSILTTTEFLQNGTTVNLYHNWSKYGVYTISVKAYDNSTESGTTEHTIWIDVWPIDDEIKGQLIDEDSNEPFDVFENIDTDKTIDVELDNETYLLDIDQDGKKEYAYSLGKGLMTYHDYVYQKYKKIFDVEIKKTPGFELVSLLIMMGVVLIIMRYKKRS
jgi:hypothetical protein